MHYTLRARILARPLFSASLSPLPPLTPPHHYQQALLQSLPASGLQSPLETPVSFSGTPSQTFLSCHQSLRLPPSLFSKFNPFPAPPLAPALQYAPLRVLVLVPQVSLAPLVNLALLLILDLPASPVLQIVPPAMMASLEAVIVSSLQSMTLHRPATV